MTMHGRKSYIGFVLLGLSGLAYTWRDSTTLLAWLTPELFATIQIAIGTFTGVAVRAAIRKGEKAAQKAQFNSHHALTAASSAGATAIRALNRADGLGNAIRGAVEGTGKKKRK